MSTAGSKPRHLTFSKQFVAKSGVAFTKGVGVKFDSVTAGVVTVDVAGANEKVIGIANESLTTTEADGVRRIECALMTGGGTLRVKVSVAGATAGLAAISGVDGFENKTFGGGTVLGHGCGQFLESGVDNDFVEMTIAPFEGVTA